MINRFRHILVWLSRIHCCRGFGIQSPTDYRFVRYVVNEHWPYYCYETLGLQDDWLKRKLGLFYFRLANFRQPSVIIDGVGMSDYLHAGCNKAQIADNAHKVELAIVSVETDVEALINRCDDASVLVVQDIWRHKRRWRSLMKHPKVRVSFDLYYCGVLMFDPTKSVHHYKINF